MPSICSTIAHCRELLSARAVLLPCADALVPTAAASMHLQHLLPGTGHQTFKSATGSQSVFGSLADISNTADACYAHPVSNADEGDTILAH